MILGKTKKKLEAKEKELYQYLSNNYKDEALRTFYEYEQLVVDLHNDGSLSDKDYNKLIPKIDEYRRIFKNFRHWILLCKKVRTNIICTFFSCFLTWKFGIMGKYNK